MTNPAVAEFFGSLTPSERLELNAREAEDLAGIENAEPLSPALQAKFEGAVVKILGFRPKRVPAANENEGVLVAPSFFPGKHVGHDKFGAGLVTAINGNRISVDFGRQGRRNIAASFLRAPSEGVLPYMPPTLPVAESLAYLAGCGNIPFTVVDAEIKEYVGATVAEFIIESQQGGDHLVEVHFFLEHVQGREREDGLRKFAEFCRALGLTAPHDIAEFLNGKACLRVPAAGDEPVYSKLAA